MPTTPSHPTKTQRARALPVGTWFVWPLMSAYPRYKYYRARIYQVIEQNGRKEASASFYEEPGLWDLDPANVNSAVAAEQRVLALAEALNRQQASAETATAYLAEHRKEQANRAVRSIPRLDEW